MSTISTEANGAAPARRYGESELADAVVKQIQEQVTHTLGSAFDAVQSSRMFDAFLGVVAMDRLTQAGRTISHGVTTNALFAGTCFFDVTRIWGLLVEGVRNFQTLVLDPSITSLGKAAGSAGSVAQASTRIAYLASALNAMPFNPLFHRVNLIATGACGGFSLAAQVGDYLHNLSVKNSAVDGELKDDALRAMVSNLLRIAESVATVAFVVVSAMAATWSMIPVTLPAAALMTASAAFGVLACFNDRFAGPSGNYSKKVERMQVERRVAKEQEELRKQEGMFTRFGTEVAKALHLARQEETFATKSEPALV